MASAEYKENKEQLRILEKFSKIDSVITDKSTNTELAKIMEHYNSYFDEESGNTKEEGINQLKEYLKQEKDASANTYKKATEEASELKKILLDKGCIFRNPSKSLTPESNTSKLSESSTRPSKLSQSTLSSELDKKSFFPIIPFFGYTVFFIRIFLAIFSVCITFKFIDLNLNFLLSLIPEGIIPEVAIPTIIITITLLIWELYRLYKKIIKYGRFVKYVFMFGKKAYTLGKQIYIFYKILKIFKLKFHDNI